MQKIPSLFVRDFENNPKLVTTNITPGCEWVIEGEGIATRKWDGTAVMVKDGLLYKRYDAKRGKTPPDGAIPCQEADPITGHWPHWVLVDPKKNEDKYIWEAYENSVPPSDGTYEAVGPKIGGNNDHVAWHMLFKHGADMIMGNFAFAHTFNGLRELLEKLRPDIEGIVFHHPDGRMCKIKRSDFGLSWPVK